MFALGQNWAELKQAYSVEVFPSVSTFKGRRKWQKATSIVRKKQWWPKLEIPNAVEGLHSRLCSSFTSVACEAW